MLVIEPRVFGDERGFFLERYHKERYAAAGLEASFVQDNHSRSGAGILRGLHFQKQHPQGKLIEVARGQIWDVIVDVRPGSDAFGHWEGFDLSEENYRQLWVPPGFAHGFCVVSEVADVLYKCTDIYRPDDEGGIAWDDPNLGIEWPTSDPVLSNKDTSYPRLRDLDAADLPQVS